MTKEEMGPYIAGLRTEAEVRDALDRRETIAWGYVAKNQLEIKAWSGEATDRQWVLDWSVLKPAWHHWHVRQEPVRSYRAAVQQALRTITRNRRARELERATLDLDTGQRSRLRRVVADWDAYTNLTVSDEAHRASGQEGTFWSQLAECEPVAFDAYLELAHLHPEIAREWGSGSRRWFDEWRHYAIRALDSGLSAGAVAGIVDSMPRGRNVFRRSALGRPRPLDLDWLRERLANAIFPNAPTAIRSPRSPVCGGGAVAT